MLSRILKIAGSAVLAVALSIPGGAHAAPATGATDKAPGRSRRTRARLVNGSLRWR